MPEGDFSLCIDTRVAAVNAIDTVTHVITNLCSHYDLSGLSVQRLHLVSYNNLYHILLLLIRIDHNHLDTNGNLFASLQWIGFDVVFVVINVSVYRLLTCYDVSVSIINEIDYGDSMHDSIDFDDLLHCHNPQNLNSFVKSLINTIV